MKKSPTQNMIDNVIKSGAAYKSHEELIKALEAQFNAYCKKEKGLKLVVDNKVKV